MQDLSASLEAVYGQANEGTNSEEILKKFYDWKCDKREEFTNVRSETEVSLQRLMAWFQSTLKVIRALGWWCPSINQGIKNFFSKYNFLFFEGGHEGGEKKGERERERE